MDAVTPAAHGEPGEPLPREELAWRVLEEVDYGLLLVGPEGQLQRANHLARHELAKARVLRLEGGRVVAATPGQTLSLHKGIEWASQGRRHMLALLHAGVGLAVACVPLSHPYEGRCGSVLLMLPRAPGTQGQAVSFFSRMHGLTPAEEAVLAALCDGLDAGQIAAAQGIAASTVRTRMRSMRGKTGIASTRALVQCIAALPPLVPPALSVNT